MTQYLDWKVGDRVVCLEDETHPHWVGRSPREGGVYTISWIGVVDDGWVHIDLEEIPQPEEDDWCRGYKAVAFRKVQPRKTDISIFTALLNGAKERERV